MPGDSDDVPVPRRGAVRPPPSEVLASVQVPRMDPPPRSLEALVPRPGGTRAARPRVLWLLGALLVMAAGAVTAYLVR